MSDGLVEMFSQMVGQNFKEMEEANKKFAADMERQGCDAREKFETAAHNLLGSKGAKAPQFRQEVLDIANMLQALPVMVPVVQHVLAQYMAEVQKAADAVKERFGVTQPPPAPEQPNGEVPSA